MCYWCLPRHHLYCVQLYRNYVINMCVIGAYRITICIVFSFIVTTSSICVLLVLVITVCIVFIYVVTTSSVCVLLVLVVTVCIVFSYVVSTSSVCSNYIRVYNNNEKYAILKLYLDDILTDVLVRDRRGRDRLVVGFTTTYGISAYHH